MVAAARGYDWCSRMPDTMSLERRALLKAYGARLVLTPGAEGMTRRGEPRRRSSAAELRRRVRAAAVREPRQPRGAPRSPPPRRSGSDTGGEVDVFVAGVGTGGTLTGVGQVLKERRPGVRVVAVEPSDSPVLSGGPPGPHRIQGIGAGFVPKVLDGERLRRDPHRERATTPSPSRARLARRGRPARRHLRRRQRVGRRRARAPRRRCSGKVVVTILCDTGERYLSTPLFADLPESLSA